MLLSASAACCRCAFEWVSFLERVAPKYRLLQLVVPEELMEPESWIRVPRSGGGAGLELASSDRLSVGLVVSVLVCGYLRMHTHTHTRVHLFVGAQVCTQPGLQWHRCACMFDV